MAFLGRAGALVERTEQELPAGRHPQGARVTDDRTIYSGPATSAQLAVSLSRRDGLIRRHGARFASFSVIGGGIFVAGLLLQAGLTSGLHVPSLASYITQAVLSVEASYFLNRWFTWKEARTPFRSSFFRFNLQKVVTITANLILYAFLLKLGVEYLLDNVLLTILFTFVNYIGADKLVFLRGSGQVIHTATGPLPAVSGPMSERRPDRQTADLAQPARREMPSVSVVIPVRSNEKTIRAAVESILGQDYPQLGELILVGSPGDSTWAALRDLDDPRLTIQETEAPPGIRDANFKRDLGIRQTSGELVSLIDSDMVLPPDWLSRAVQLLLESEVDCVAGVMRSVRDDFWGRFVDSNSLGAKTPRAKSAYLVTAKGFGAAQFKPPITADILFARRIYEDCPIDSSWSHGSLEDYEWFWRVVKRGHQVLVSDELFGWHHHRASLRDLAREYRRSARGCAYFIRAHRDSPFAKKRMTQAIVLPVGVFGILLGIGVAAYTGHGKFAAVIALAIGVAGVALLSAWEFARSRRLESFLYPVPALVLGLNYTASLAAHLMRNAPMSQAVPVASELPVVSEDAPSRRRGLSGLLRPLTFILALQAGLSLSLIWTNTAFPDEADYLWVGKTLIGHAIHGTSWPTAYAHQTLSGLPYFYPVMGAIANTIGGLAGARILSLVFMLCSTVLMYSAANRLFDRNTAVAAAALWSVFAPTLQLGAFATYDAMSVMLTTLAVWSVIRTVDSRRRGEMVAVSGAVLALAEVTAYSGVIMIPIVIIFALLVWVPAMGFRQAVSCTAWLAGACIVVFCGIMTVSKDWQGIFTTIFSRQVSAGGASSAFHVFDDSWTYSGLIAILALVGIVFAVSEGNRGRSIQVAFLAAIALIIPVAQANEGTAVSLKKHLAYGAIFAVMAAAYSLAKIARSLPAQRVSVIACCAVAIIYPAVNGFQQSQSWYQSWPNEGSLLSKLEPMLKSNSVLAVELTDGNYLCPYYFAGMGNSWENCVRGVTIGTVEQARPNIIVIGYLASITPPGGLPSDLLLSPSVSQSDFLGAINTAATTGGNAELPQITKILETSGEYRLVSTGPYNSNQSSGDYTIWERATQQTHKAVER